MEDQVNVIVEKEESKSSDAINT
ncbi:hypothetical protein A2U01_0098105, partial [Trifolium medium]|nr:hypothetical protein [Trifolium medium]